MANLIELQIIAEQLLKRIDWIESHNSNYTQSKKWRHYKEQEKIIYEKIKKEKGERENEKN